MFWPTRVSSSRTHKTLTGGTHLHVSGSTDEIRLYTDIVVKVDSNV
jgi:hypothetical protein